MSRHKRTRKRANRRARRRRRPPSPSVLDVQLLEAEPGSPTARAGCPATRRPPRAPGRTAGARHADRCRAGRGEQRDGRGAAKASQGGPRRRRNIGRAWTRILLCRGEADYERAYSRAGAGALLLEHGVTPEYLAAPRRNWRRRWRPSARTDAIVAGAARHQGAGGLLCRGVDLLTTMRQVARTGSPARSMFSGSTCASRCRAATIFFGDGAAAMRGGVCVTATGGGDHAGVGASAGADRRAGGCDLARLCAHCIDAGLDERNRSVRRAAPHGATPPCKCGRCCATIPSL